MIVDFHVHFPGRIFGGDRLCKREGLQVDDQFMSPNQKLVGGWTNPFEKYARQIGSFPQGSGVNIENIWKQPPPKDDCTEVPDSWLQ